MIQYYQAVILGLLQGFSELFPISSLGHSVILPKILGWNIQQNDKFFLNFLVATHLATALVLLGFFWRDWVRIVTGLFRSLRDRQIAPEDSDARLGRVLRAVEETGAWDRTAFVLVADHGMEESDPAVTGDWGVTLREAGVAFRDEAYGFLYLGEH